MLGDSERDRPADGKDGSPAEETIQDGELRDEEIVRAIVDDLAAWEVSGQSHADFARHLLGLCRRGAP